VSLLSFAFAIFILILGAHFLVNGASALAKRLGVAEIVIGLTVVAFGTSTPEFVVSMFSGLGSHHDMVYGNVIGSNIFNILLILGISGLIFPLRVQHNTVWKEIPFSLLAVVLLFVLVNDALLYDSDVNVLSRADGIILFMTFIIFLVYVFIISRVKSADVLFVEEYSVIKTICWIIIGFAALFLGGKLAVDNAVLIARQIGVSEKLIALTLVAGGTSLPELATSAVAAYKRRCDMAIGNIVGSNVFNIYFILGIGSVIRGTLYDTTLNIDLIVLFFSTLVLFLTMFTGNTRRLDRWEAAIFLMGYVSYLLYVIGRK